MDSAVTVLLYTCDGCAFASARSRETGDVVICLCGRRFEPATPPRRPPPRLIYVAPDGDAPVPPPTAIERAGAAARALRPDDPELVRVRRVLADLRPDCPDPHKPPVAVVEASTSYAPTIRDPSAAWGGLPRGLLTAGETEAAYEALARRSVADVLAAIDALPAPAPSTLRWLRDRATLSAGLRGLFVDAGVWAGAGGDDLGARREAAYLLGRKLVLRACAAWETRKP